MTEREALKLALELAHEGVEIHSPNSPEYKVCAALIALAQPEQDCNYCGGTGDVSGEYPGVACLECNGSGVRVQPEFIKHEVETAEDWSEWVCPNPQSYLMKCCDCGLVHEAQFRVAKYQPEPSEDFVVADDPDLQAQFRMRRNEQWSPKDTAYRPGGLAQPEQEPVEWGVDWGPDGSSVSIIKRLAGGDIEVVGWEYAPHPPQRKPLDEREHEWIVATCPTPRHIIKAVEAAHGIFPENSDCHGPDWTDRDGEYLK